MASRISSGTVSETNRPTSASLTLVQLLADMVEAVLKQESVLGRDGVKLEKTGE